MEVHHHHPHVEKKNFKEYFLEFLMIFLAVTLWFFAENLREHIKDDNEIHENIQSVLAENETTSGAVQVLFFLYETAIEQNCASAMHFRKYNVSPGGENAGCVS
jgi:hypothetical protein